MIEKEFAKSQVLRLAGLKGFPHDYAEAIKELVIALQCTESEQRARDVIDRYVCGIEVMDCPRPPDIRREIFNSRTLVAPPPDSFDASALCEICESWGYILKDGKYERCSCANGQQLEQTLLDMMNAPKSKSPGRATSVKDIIRLNEILNR